VNVLLINPPTEHIIRESLPPVVEDSTGVYPPLGLLYVAAYAEAVEGCEVKVIDCPAENLDHKSLAAKIAAFAPEVIGIQAMSFTLVDALMVARCAKGLLPGSLIVMGGPHPTLYPLETAGLPFVDAAVQGEGEYPFASLLEELKAGRSLEGISGIVTKKNAQTGTIPGRFPFIEKLDELRMPARHLLDLSRYTSPLASQKHVTTMMSSRGCPGRCIFCDRPQMGKKFRKRSAGSVFAEMAHCVHELGMGEIIFYDDTFTIDEARVLELCDRIVSSGLRVLWDIRARVDTVTPEMIARLRRAGCMRIHYGVETGSARLQKVIRKNLDLGKVRDVFARTRQEGIETLGYFMMGLPSESRDEIDKTMEMILSLPMDYAHIALFTAYPGTDVYREALASGFYKEDYWRQFACDPRPGFAPRYWNEHFSDAELLALLKQAYGQFYCRPGYVLRRLLRVRSAGELLRKATIGLKLFGGVAFSR
jgi:anaerobic magnesium-protoporphyrin IX monomethyl ester cyclase